MGEFFWLFPLIMLVVCVLMMRKGGMCGMRRRSRDSAERDQRALEVSPVETLNRRYALGEIGKAEYEEKKATITQSTSDKYRLPA